MVRENAVKSGQRNVKDCMRNCEYHVCSSAVLVLFKGAVRNVTKTTDKSDLLKVGKNTKYLLASLGKNWGV